MNKKSLAGRLKVQKELIKSMYQEGNTITEILEFVDVNYEYVLNYLKKEGLVRKKKQFSFEEVNDQIIKLFKEGSSIADICKELNISGILVASILKKQNLMKSKYFYGGKVFDSHDRMIGYQKEIAINVRIDYDKGKSFAQLKEDYKISLHAVKLIVKLGKTGIE